MIRSGLTNLVSRRRIVGSLIAGAATFLMPAAALAVPPIPETPRDYRAVWCATVSQIDWPPVAGVSASTVNQQKAALINHLDVMVSAKMNAMYLQVRPASDAMYQSSLEPPSIWLTGSQDTQPTYDPLEFAVTEAHKRGIELHAWINPYRASTNLATWDKAANHVTKLRPDLCITHGSQIYMDPGHPDSIAWVKNVIGDLVTRYDIDGVVLDDYFYPGTSFADSHTYDAYVNGGGTLDLHDWRRSNVDTLIRESSELVHGIKPWCQFGVGPFGIWRPNNPPGIIGADYYATHYCDTRKWLQEGWVDSLSPQLYWTLDSTGQPFGDLIDWWVAQNTERNVLASTAVYRVGNGAHDSAYHQWSTKTNQEIVDQVNRTHQAGGVGNVHFSMRWLTANNRDSLNIGLLDALKDGPYSGYALPPSRSWLDNVPPPAPDTNLGSIYGSPARRDITFSQKNTDEPAMWWCVNVYDGSQWNLTVLPGTETSFTAMEPVVEYAVSAVDRSGNESARSGFTAVHDWELY